MKKHKEFSKIIIVWIVLNSTIWIYLSYVLAMLDKIQIAETLSNTVVIQLLGAILIYALKALFENISKHKSWPDKERKENNHG